jgi:hypothetical protein
MKKEIRRIEKDLSMYENFIQTYKYRNKYVRCLFINAYNHFLSGYILSQKGLKTQCLNSLRMGLESEWIGICLDKDIELAMHWAFGSGQEKNIHDKLSDLEKPYKLRKMLGDTKRIKIKDRNDIYKALSDASHTKLASITVYTGEVECITIGGLRGTVNIIKILQAVQFVHKFAYAEIEEQLGYKFSEAEWNFNRTDLMRISQSGYGFGNGNIEPAITSQGRPGSDALQALALLDFIKKGSIE